MPSTSPSWGFSSILTTLGASNYYYPHFTNEMSNLPKFPLSVSGKARIEHGTSSPQIRLTIMCLNGSPFTWLRDLKDTNDIKGTQWKTFLPPHCCPGSSCPCSGEVTALVTSLCRPPVFPRTNIKIYVSSFPPLFTNGSTYYPPHSPCFLHLTINLKALPSVHWNFLLFTAVPYSTCIVVQ